MASNIKLFDLSTLTRREITVVLTASLLFLVFQITVVGILPTHFLMVALFLLFYFAHPLSRKMAIALLPFIAFEVCYDWMRLYPNYRVNSVDIKPIYEAELSLFGITSEGTTMIPGEYFMLHHNGVADFLSGCFYLCWVPLPIFFAIALFFMGKSRRCVHFTLCFLFVNLVGFVIYYIHPAAPPWYVLEHGFEPDFSTPGNVAGLIRFDEMVGIPVFQSIYVGNSNVFAAVPSLHAAYMLITTIYAARYKVTRVIFAIVTAGIWWTAVYSCHHYIIDVILGIATAVVGFLLFEKVLMRTKKMRALTDSYAAYILYKRV
ncbi:MAG: phosphatase PAP2 family protein [Prevotella sp.]|nr:phosphatase PAP2 family protein [Prevotella sp.]